MKIQLNAYLQLKIDQDVTTIIKIKLNPKVVHKLKQKFKNRIPVHLQAHYMRDKVVFLAIISYMGLTVSSVE